MRRDLKPFAPSAAQRGSSMLEILVTLVIVAIALLGTAGLQLNAMRVNKGGQFRTQAIFMASDMAERMEANKAEAVLGTYAVAATSAVGAAATNCAAAACNSAGLAAWDISQWGTNITAALPQPTWSITTAGAANPITYTIVINWTDRSNVKTVASGGIVDTYTATRTIGN
ncbi:MAG: type IV pilus modification protein PilV [Nitrosomonadales bacterium]|nr:type IV pilus modification protein PilV [Nitrosomonadales bacterium]